MTNHTYVNYVTKGLPWPAIYERTWKLMKVRPMSPRPDKFDRIRTNAGSFIVVLPIEATEPFLLLLLSENRNDKPKATVAVVGLSAASNNRGLLKGGGLIIQVILKMNLYACFNGDLSIIFPSAPFIRILSRVTSAFKEWWVVSRIDQCIITVRTEWGWNPRLTVYDVLPLCPYSPTL